MKNVQILIGLIGLSCMAACGDDLEAGLPEGPGETAGLRDQDIGLIEMALETVPAEVNCVRINANGPYREKAVDVPVVPGPAMVQTIGGFPLGKVAFAAAAFSQACGSVTTKTIPSWVSDPQEVSIVEGAKTRVSFLMQRNGRVDVALDFADEPACTAAGFACKSVRECCSNVCKAGVCEP